MVWGQTETQHVTPCSTKFDGQSLKPCDICWSWLYKLGKKSCNDAKSFSTWLERAGAWHFRYFVFGVKWKFNLELWSSYCPLIHVHWTQLQTIACAVGDYSREHLQCKKCLSRLELEINLMNSNLEHDLLLNRFWRCFFTTKYKKILEF